MFGNYGLYEVRKPNIVHVEFSVFGNIKTSIWTRNCPCSLGKN